MAKDKLEIEMEPDGQTVTVTAIPDDVVVLKIEHATLRLSREEVLRLRGSLRKAFSFVGGE